MDGTMRSAARRMGAIAMAFSLAWAAIGCGRSSSNAPPPATPANVSTSEDQPTAGLIEHHRHHHHGGVMLFIAMSLDTLGVSPEQRAAVEKIREDLHAKMDPARMAEQSLLGTLADELAADRLDASKVDAAIAQMSAASAAVHEATIDALNHLHEVLTPAQRAALIDKVESHWAVWQNANGEKTAQGRSEDDHLTALATDLGLTPEQVGQIRSGLGEGMKGGARFDSQEIDAYLRAFAGAFQSETFDARALITASGANAHLVGRGALHLARLVEAAFPVLTADQRAELAQRLRMHANHNPSAQGNP